MPRPILWSPSSTKGCCQRSRSSNLRIEALPELRWSFLNGERAKLLGFLEIILKWGWSLKKIYWDFTCRWQFWQKLGWLRQLLDPCLQVHTWAEGQHNTADSISHKWAEGQQTTLSIPCLSLDLRSSKYPIFTKIWDVPIKLANHINPNKKHGESFHHSVYPMALGSAASHWGTQRREQPTPP